MGHHIVAIVTCEDVDLSSAESLHLPVFTTPTAIIIGLHPIIIDFWADKLGIKIEWFSELIGDNNIVQYFANKLGISKFAIIETNYLGGKSSQSALVYQQNNHEPPYSFSKISIAGKQITMPINQALKEIGIITKPKTDEFDTIELGTHRDFYDYFEWINEK